MSGGSKSSVHVTTSESHTGCLHNTSSSGLVRESHIPLLAGEVGVPPFFSEHAFVKNKQKIIFSYPQLSSSVKRRDLQTIVCFVRQIVLKTRFRKIFFLIIFGFAQSRYKYFFSSVYIITLHERLKQTRPTMFWAVFWAMFL